ncbi:CotH kinase family protein [Roseimicrobium gellanilyticum]|nr:CotH kinase family protein [Roseimicrobium gellanilyticum]
MEEWSTAGMLGYEQRARPELILGVDKISERQAAMLQAGLLKMSHTFATPEELASDSSAAIALYGKSCPSPQQALLARSMPPSTALLPARGELAPDITVISLVCRAQDLFDAESGIIANKEETGQEWERPAWLSAQRGSHLLVESPVGLRVHGGFNRKTPQTSFRLVFHSSYSGHDAAPAGLFFGGDSPASTEFILTNAAHPSRFNAALATEIATLAGCHTSRCTPAVVYLNGTRIPAPYFIYQRQSEEFVKDRFGLADVDWVRLKSRRPNENENYIIWRKWIRRERYPISMAEEGARFDLEELSAWVLAMTFTATTDNNQGGYFRDRSSSDAVWRTLTWDMDQAFNEIVQVVDGRRINYSEQPFEAIIGDRARLFFRLIEGSSEYRDYFRRFVRHKLESSLTQENLGSLLERYVHIARMQPDKAPELLDALARSREFLTTRRDTYLQYVEQRLQQAEEFHRKRLAQVTEN